MSKVAIVYWSGTGNTEMMASAVADGIKGKGGEVSMLTADKFKSSMVDDFDSIAFGCPSMGVESLEESEFEPMFNDCKSKLSGKKIALFGSYDWGDGEWMRNWQDECNSLGAKMACDFVICNGTPDDSAKESCKKLGEALI